ncbi:MULTISPECIES: sensor histidine kinase [Clostridium]|uniref:sensor histidine kinase n=1 Tax=Clostridium TaxID=1485 RepID=UPI000825C088|nr:MULTISPECIES: histidine kinase [Clostridium]PJI07575.1 sensor histidine kinase [Clostridium sp. CT7]
MRKYISEYKNSLVFKAALAATIVMLILMLTLIINNIYSFYVVRTNTINSSQNELKIYINDINNSFNGTLNDLNEIASNVGEILDIGSENESLRYFSQEKLQDILTERISNNKYAHAFVIYNIEHNILLSSYNKELSYLDKLELSESIKSNLYKRKYTLEDLWAPIKINDKIVFFKAYNFSGNIIAAFISSDTLMKFVNKSDSNIRQQIVLSDKKGNPLIKSGNASFSNINYPLPVNKNSISSSGRQYIINSYNIETSYARLFSIIEEKNLFLGLNYVQWIIAILGASSLLLLLYVVYYLNKEVIKPVKALIIGTKEVEKGNFDYRVKYPGNLFEFQTLNKSFNLMIGEIKTLKISEYEKKIELQKAELKYLHMQIRPHFFLNALTTIHSLTYKNKDEEIRKFIDALSNHLRYMFKGGTILVSIKEEIEYVKSYFYMQEIKFPNSVFYVIDVEPSLEKEKIPQFLIHTFVENSFKHAMTLEETLSVFINVKYCTFEGDEAIKIVIEDSGEGFPEDILNKVNGSYNTDDSDGYKIGISNIKRTLAIFYGKDNLLKISNEEATGGRVEIIIPRDGGYVIEGDNN